MKHKIRACLSLFVCVCMLFGMMPVSIIEAAGAKISAQQMEEEPTASTDSTQVVSLAESSDSEENGVSSTADSGQEETSNEITGSEEYLDESVTVDISPLQDDAGEDMLTALTGERLTAVVSAYNDNPNYTATAAIRIYVEQISGNSKIELTELPKVTLSGAGSSDSASAATVEAVWHEVDGDVTIPYLEVTIPSGASIVFYMTLLCPTGYDDLASAQIYAEITETDEATDTETTTSYPKDSNDRLTFNWIGESAWSDFTKSASLSAIGVTKDSVIKADEVDWTFSAKNNTSGSVGVVYTNYITLTDTLVLPEGLSVSGGTAVTDSSSVIKSKSESGKQTIGEIHDANDDVVYAIFLDDTYKDDYTVDLSVSVNADGQTEIAYSVTIKNSDVTNVSFNPVSAISTAIYMDVFQSQAASASLAGKEMLNTAKLTVYSVIEDETLSAGSTDPVYEVLYRDKDETKVKFDDTYSYGVAKSVYQVKDGIGNVTYGYGLNKGVTETTLSNEKVDTNGTPYVAQGYTVTYKVSVSSTYTTATKTDMTDTIPSQLTLDTTTITVKSGSNTLAENIGYTYETETDGSGNTILTVHLLAVLAGGSVDITYSCTVNDTATAELTEITNTAKVGDEEAEAVVKTPENGEIKIEREIIQRETTTSNGYTLRIYKDLDTGKYGCEATSDAMKAYFGMTSPSQAELADAILKVNAGDTIEYLITVENNSLEDVYGTVYESNLFSDTVTYDTSGSSAASALINDIVGGWSLYSAGCEAYLSAGADKSGTLTSVTSPAWNSESKIQGLCKYFYSDLETNSNGNGINDTNNNCAWNFYGTTSAGDACALHANTTYHQTTVLQIPGDNTVSSASETNAGFQNLVSAYAYYCTTGYGNNASGTTAPEWLDYAFLVQTSSSGNPNTGKDIHYTTNKYAHVTERQIYLNTGTLASTVVADADALSTTDGLIQAQYTGTTLNANDYEDSSKYFSADENSVVVNYVYLYNDSSEEMNLEDYSVSIVLPTGFEWVGFTYPYDVSGDYRTYSQANESEVFLKNYYSGDNYNLWVNNTRRNPMGSISYKAYTTVNTGTNNNESYYSGDNNTFPQTNSEMKVPSMPATNDQDSVTDNLLCSTESKAGATGTVTLEFKNDSGDTVISPCSGIVIMYVAKVSDASTVKNTYTGTENDSNAAATFQAYIEREYNLKFGHNVKSEEYCMSQLSPVIRAQDVGSITKYSLTYTTYRRYTSNDGNANTFLEHKLDNFYSASSDTVAGGTTGENASRMWSYVSLSMCVETTSVSVTKEVVKNNGADSEGQYTNKNLQTIYSGLVTGGFASSYDDYVWNYPLYDGLHRTVDGTVTWKVTIANTGEDTSGNTETSTSTGAVYDYSAVNYSTLVETIDSPYHLIEIAVPYVQYASSDKSVVGTNFTWIYFELPDADPEDQKEMEAAGWVYDSSEDSYYYEVYARSNRGSNAGTQLNSLGNLIAGATRFLYMRVTVRCIENGSLGYGYDVDCSEGNQNTCAYQYLIEFVSPVIAANINTYPLLFTEEEVASGITGLSSSIEFYLTFSTDDSIETNYNSFGLALKDVEDVSDVTVEEGESGEVTTAGEMHTADTASSTPNNGAALLLAGSSGSTNYTGLTESAGILDPSTVVVQANDWTDTSYTYGEKTLTVLDEDGNVATDDSGDELTINSREDGDMTLPTSVSAGTTIHNTLKWESVLYESENYSGVTDLVLYDVYGVQSDVSSTGEVMSGYNVDFSSINVQLCLTDDIAANKTAGYGSTDDDFVSTELVMGTDYEIYYTMDPLVSTEHHPISVNSLYYAADLENLETVTWIKYDPDDPTCDGTGAMGFKIILLNTGAAGTIYNAKYYNTSNYYSDWARCEIYVDYNATVSDSVIAGESYPNVMAWTADVIYPTNGSIRYKSIQQDTTAMLFKASDVVYPTLSKKVVDEDDKDISSQISSDEEFTYLIFRTDSGSYSSSILTSDSDVTGIAVATIHAGEEITLDDSHLTVLYNNYEAGDDSAGTFWNAKDSCYYIVEMDSGKYTEESIAASDSTNATAGTASSQKIGGLTTAADSITSIATAILVQAAAAANADEKAALEAQAALYEAVAEYITTSSAAKTAYFSVDSSASSWSLTLAGINRYMAPALVIRKVDTNDAVIMNEVKFQLQDAAGNVLCFTETSGGYAYEGVDGAVTASGTTTDLVFNGTTSVTGLPEGTYYLVETEAPDGYTITTASVKTKVEIAAERDTNGELVTIVEVSVENEADSTYTTGSLKLVKVDASTLLPIRSGSASFQIYASNAANSEPLAFTQDEDNGTPIDGQYTYGDGTGWTTVTTDAATGTLNISGLPYGTYYLVETSAPEGYLANFSTLATAYEFEVSRTLAVTEIDLPNTYIQADIVITKTDENGNVITGNPASFALTDEQGYAVTFTCDSDGVYTYDDTGTVTTLQTSSADGTLTMKNLPKGKYTVTETGAPKGYEISTDPISITVENTDKEEFTVQNKEAVMRLRIAKTWRLEGGTKTYALSGVNFTLYQVDASTNTATTVKSGTTDSSGILDLEDLDWSEIYYLYEEVPEGYSASGSLSTVYLEDATGEIDLSVTESTNGYTAISCIYIDMATTINSTNSSGEEYCTYTDSSWTYEVDVLNVKNNTYGGMYASTSYKTISNAKTAALYDWLEEQTGYSYFYKDTDYAAGNYNYVRAVKQGDTVTYTLNISNVSDYEFSGLVIIDRLPETGDTGIVNSSAKRSSEFTVAKPSDIVVTVDGKEVSTSLYTVTYSANIKFTDSDFNGTTIWDDTWTDGTSKSFRIVFDSSFTLDPGQTVVVTYDGVVGDDADIGELAWNNFAYRYTVYDNSQAVTASLMTLAAEEGNNTGVKLARAGTGITQITLTPEPPKVGVYIGGESYTVTKQWEDDDNSLGLRPDTIILKLSLKNNTTEELMNVKNGTVKLTFTEGQNGEDDSITAEIVEPVSGSKVEAEASFDADGNWVCQWTGLDVLTSGYSYVVEETDTGNANYVWSFAKEMVDDGSGTGTLVESDSRGILTNTLQFITLNLTKQDSDGSELEGAEFTLERKTDTGWETVDTVYTVEKDTNGTVTGVSSKSLTTDDLTTDSSGTIVISGLIAGTYRITEVKTKEGYTLLTEPMVVDLPISYTKDEAIQKGIDVTGAYLTGGTYYFYNVTYTITNTANFTMPAAGASAGGEWVSGLLGAMLLAGAWIILRRRRRTANLINHLPGAV